MNLLAHPLSARSRWLRTPINSGDYRNWLLDKASLTRRLQSLKQGFRVLPLSVAYAKAGYDEVALVTMPLRCHALIRDVQLLCGGAPAVYAHSVLPRASLRGTWQGLGKLGSRPLGATLFADARIARTPLEFRKLTRTHPLYRQAVAGMQQAPRQLWARRSVFRLKHASILVTEVFLPQVLSL